MSNQIVEVEAEPVEQVDLSVVETDPTFWRRAKRHHKEGYKDGLCGIMQSLKDMPPKFRAHYNAGHTLGLYDRGDIGLQQARTA